MNLGIACLYLQEYEHAEKVLVKANILDTSNANVWGFLTLCMLKKGKRINNAFQSLKQSITLNIDNIELMIDIGESFKEFGHYQTAKKALEYAIITRVNSQSQKH